ncbi:MAG: photosystem II stability/assembly factor-like uncharacterized protein [Marivirga sp.]|jgi:photosystem II stability/assembly factor-like uncharacterized protein
MIISTGRIYILICLICGSQLSAQHQNMSVDSVETQTSALIIGLDGWDSSYVWASGTSGTVLRSEDGGNSWKEHVYEKADSLQFRAIKALSATEALVMSAGEGAASQLLKFSVRDGWQHLYTMEHEDGFLDAIELFPNGTAIAYGDAIDSSYFILLSDTTFSNWKRIYKTPIPGVSEGGFASSGTNIAIGENGKAWIGTGAGGNANVLISEDYGQSWTIEETPMVKGEAAGITAIRQKNNYLFIAGGDLAISMEYTDNLFFSDTNGKQWQAFDQPLTKGAFYGAAINPYNGALQYIVCGPAGADIWLSKALGWQKISSRDLWTVEFIDEQHALLAGRNGYMIKVTLND